MLRNIPVREVKLGEQKKFTQVVQSLPFRALLIEEEGGEKSAAVRKAFEALHGTFNAHFLFGRLSVTAGGLAKIQKDFPKVETLPALVVAQSEYAEVFDGDLEDPEATKKFFEHMSEKQARVVEEEKPHISHTSFSVIFVGICILAVVGFVVVARRGNKSPDSHKSA